MEHKNNTNTQNKTLSKQTKHDMAEENSIKSTGAKGLTLKNKYNLI